MECLFCNIIKKEIPAHVIYEDEYAIAFLDVHPRSRGHTMVLPKTHSETILDLPDEQIGQLFLAVKKVTALLKKALSEEGFTRTPNESNTRLVCGFTIGINHGTNAGQLVPHLHVHVIPRYKGDGGKSIHSVVDNPPKESLEETLIKIQNTPFRF